MFEIVSRDRWGSTSKWKFGNMKLPAVAAYLHHTVTLTSSFPYRDAKVVENVGIQTYGQMSYSYLVHPLGVILEGAGTKTGAHMEDRNSTAFGIGLIGNYTTIDPTDAQIEAVRWLLYHLKVEMNILNDNAVLIPHRAVKATACPGDRTMLVLDEMRTPWVPPAPTEVRPMFDPPLVLEPIAAELEHNGGLYLLASSGALYAFGGAPPIRGANGRDFFVGRVAARLYTGTDPQVPTFAQGPANSVVIQATSGEWYGSGAFVPVP